ncbi:hypothetical protein PG987_015595 [Apiospora arundinis]
MLEYRVGSLPYCLPHKSDNLEGNNETEDDGDDALSTPPVPKSQGTGKQARPEPQANIESDDNDEQILISDKEQPEDLGDQEEQRRQGARQPEAALNLREAATHAADNSSQEKKGNQVAQFEPFKRRWEAITDGFAPDSPLIK